MRRGDLSRGEELLAVMDDIYSVLITMDFPDAITGGLRRTTDMVRGVLERTRSDLTLAIRQEALENKLASFQKKRLTRLSVPPVDTQQEKREEIHGEAAELDATGQEIYKALAEWRSRKANEESLAPFIIAHNSILKQIARLRPTTPKDFASIKGFGERRVNKYGKEIIAVIHKGR
jgi:superfamily II DNA helicase RecQ